jgi:CRISPR/Cas system CMR-associated protein Cmr5 small subunit
LGRNIEIIINDDGLRVVRINDVRFKGKNKEDWKKVENYLKEYVGEYYEIEESSEKVYISSDFPDEYANSESRLALKGAVAKAKANASQGIPELIRIATNEIYSENTKTKHNEDAKQGWYRYDVRFELPVFNDKTGEIDRYNRYYGRMLVRHAEDGKRYLYDILGIKKETSSPLEP